MTKTSKALTAALPTLILAACAPDRPVDSGLSSTGGAPAPPSWIWSDVTADDQELSFEKTFQLAEAPSDAVLIGTCDNRMDVLINGQRVGSHDRWEELVAWDVSDLLAPGENTLEVGARNESGPGGLVLQLDLGGGRSVVTDASWRVAPARSSSESGVQVLGRVGEGGLPWSPRITLDSFARGANGISRGETGAPQAPRLAKDLTLLPGFEAELLYTVPGGSQGSWVSLTSDPQGRLYASDERDRGLYRITPAQVGDPAATTVVERVPVDLSGAQGLCWAFDSLYVNVSGKGLWRVQDTDSDDQLDGAEHLIEIADSGEHGPHAIVPTEDGQGLYFIGGNHTRPPQFDGSRAPSNWGEDLLLPRQWDPSGHARGRLAPGGWIARCEPDGTNVEIVSNGYRNQYDIALSPEGELFTYDADMEWDLGLPWYRPTRICHATSGSEFGWRSGTGKWPAYYEDSLPATLDIGPGSPTGLLFGTGLAFPDRYQRALFALDWTFGTIYAVHLQPAGASYTATKEEFVWAKPLALTDATVGVDGALYFAVGGRGTQSALYRVRYTGSASTAAAGPANADASSAARELRRSLEAFHGRIDPEALDAAWPALSSDDRFVRFAARIAVENQPAETWRARALMESDLRAAIEALLALARQGSASDLSSIVGALGRIDAGALDEPWLLAALRTYAVAFARQGEPAEADRERILAQLEPLLPSSSTAVNTELVRLLVYLDSTKVVAQTLELIRSGEGEGLPEWADLIARNDTYGRPIAKMLADMPPVQGIAYAFLLRNATRGWTLPLRKQYFEFFVSASTHPGGNSYAKFLENMRDDAAAELSPADERSLAPLLGQSLVAALPADVTPPVGPGRQWTLDEAIATVGRELVARDFAAGQNLYHATACSMCHRFDGQGGAMGPDLTTVANNFSLPDLLEAIVEPSKVISDQYGSHTVVADDGRIAVGILVEDVDKVTVYPRALSAPPVEFERAEIASIEESSVSQMPQGLVDRLNPEELKDLVAYLMSGGDPKSELFQAPAGGGSD
ncbi:c-type cytochrome [Engelhardtia mirabilis]|uniref:c-type cytochrome n=1 Tax=Engelhardtia mirabilis TaxID=2528011 RepID=UPI003AF3F12F